LKAIRVLLFPLILAFSSGCDFLDNTGSNSPTPPELDATPPELTLTGSQSMIVMVNSVFNDPGATAFDDVDGIIAVSVEGDVDTTTAGNYNLLYTATDNTGNVATKSRIVSVTPIIFNVNRSMGMGITGISDWSTALPFIDLMKQSREWYNWDDKDDDRPFDLDEHDWVMSLAPDQRAGTVFLSLPNDDALIFDRVIVLYEGEGVLSYTWSSRLIAEESVPGRDVVSVGTNSNLLTIMETNPDNPIRNIRIIPDIYFEAFEKGNIFNPDWLARIDAFRAIRFMDWMNTNGSTQAEWAHRPHPGDRTWRVNDGVPLEIMIQLANHTGANPWFNIPHLADENYMQQFAKMVKAQLIPSLEVYIEHSNEVWNWGFEQAQYANVTGRARWGNVGNAYMQWHGMRTAQVCDAFKLGAFADSTERVKCVLGVQTGYHGIAAGAIDCPLWVAEGNDPCYQHGIDYIGLTTYFSAGLNGPTTWRPDPDHEPTLRGWLNDADGGIDKAYAQLNYGTQLRHLKAFENYAGIANELREEMAYWSTYASSYSLGLVAYEGGQHITANGLTLFNQPDIVAFHTAINRDLRMEQVYLDMMNVWKEGGGELHMHFVELGTPGIYGSWGNLENLSQLTSPRWDAISTFNNTVDCWWQGCGD